MANITTKNPMVLDTAGTILTTPAHISAITWGGYTAGDNLVITDIDGNTIVDWDAPTETITPQIGFSLDVRVRGLIIATMDAGEIFVYLK